MSWQPQPEESQLDQVRPDTIHVSLSPQPSEVERGAAVVVFFGKPERNWVGQSVSGELIVLFFFFSSQIAAVSLQRNLANNVVSLRKVGVPLL